MLKEITISTKSHSQMIDITGTVQTVVSETGVSGGICHVFVPHTTAGITINENADPSVVSDFLRETEKIVPWNDGYQHLEGNSAAHIKASMMGFSQAIFVQNGKLVLGTWQSIYFCEFDGPRTRKVLIKVVEG
jgi:secondary thiamine-phosphate synthase enzyme